MPKYSRKELCALLNISQAFISMAVKRGQLILSNGLIDDQDPRNALYIENKIGGALPSPEYKGTPAAPKADPLIPRTNGNTTEQFSLNIVKTKVSIKKLNEEYELAKIRKEKLQEKHIPIEIIKALLVAQSENLKIAWEYAAEDLIVRLSSRMQLTRVETAEIKSFLNDIINKATIKQADETKKSLRKLNKEFSESKGRGEHE
jgi:hypothetical protein